MIVLCMTSVCCVFASARVSWAIASMSWSNKKAVVFAWQFFLKNLLLSFHVLELVADESLVSRHLCNRFRFPKIFNQGGAFSSQPFNGFDMTADCVHGGVHLELVVKRIFEKPFAKIEEIIERFCLAREPKRTTLCSQFHTMLTLILFTLLVCAYVCVFHPYELMFLSLVFSSATSINFDKFFVRTYSASYHFLQSNETDFYKIPICKSDVNANTTVHFLHPLYFSPVHSHKLLVCIFRHSPEQSRLVVERRNN